MTNLIMVAIGGVILSAGFLVFGTLPSYFNETHKLHLAALLFIFGGAIMVAGIIGLTLNTARLHILTKGLETWYIMAFLDDIKKKLKAREEQLKKKRTEKELASEMKNEQDLARLKMEVERLKKDVEIYRESVEKARQIRQARKDIKDMENELHPSAASKISRGLGTVEKGLVKGGHFAIEAAKATNKFYLP